MNKQFSIKRFVGITIILFIVGVLFDSYTTYLLFNLSMEDMMKYEFSKPAIEKVMKYGSIGVFYFSVDDVIAYMICLILGSFVTAIFFFNQFRQDFSYTERVIIIICIGVMVLAAIKIGVGLNNLYVLVRG